MSKLSSEDKDLIMLNRLVRKQVKELIAETGISMAFLSNKIGLSRNTISLWVRGKYNLKQENIDKLKVIVNILLPLLDVV